VSALFLAPDLGAGVSPFVLAPAAVAEIAMLFWLLVKGVKVPRGASGSCRGLSGLLQREGIDQIGIDQMV
jgi:hypothetical protein